MYSLAFGTGTRNAKNEWLEVYYPAPLFNPDDQLVSDITNVVAYDGNNVDIDLDDAIIDKLIAAIKNPEQVHILSLMKGSTRPCVLTLLEEDSKPATTPEAYLKLHLLSHRYVRPNEQNLEDIFSLLPNVAWTNMGAVDPAEITDLQLKARTRGNLLEVTAIDKFPRMTNYVLPAGVRIAHGARVRLGAYLGEGTTVMHEGFVNFNAGAIGPNMIEGRLSQGVIMEPGSDLGGSASTAGTLSGGGSIVISIGKDCLVSANAGTGIPLGDRCTIEAGLYITPGTLVQVLDEHRNPVEVVKARTLAGQSDMLFIRNSQTGVVECRSNRKAIELNKALHTHN